MYAEGSNNTVSSEDIKNIVLKNPTFHLDELKADISIKNDKYYFGYKKAY